MKPPLLVTRDARGGLCGAYVEDAEAIGRLKRDAVYSVELKRARNPANHRRFFALVQLVAERHPTYTTVSMALTAIKLAAGHVEWSVDPVNGGLVPIPKSISFGEMDDEEQFRQLFDAAITGVMRHILPAFSREEIDDCVNQVMAFA